MVCIISLLSIAVIIIQRVITPVRPVDPSATGIKIKSRDQGVINSSNQRTLQSDDQAC